MNQITSYTQPKTLPAFLAPSAPVGIESVQKVAEQIAELGRYEDNYIVHASEGETVVPLAVLNRNPGLKDSLFKQMRQMGLDPERYIVGSQLNSINPVTGQPEFFLKKLGKGFKNVFKTIAPIVLPAVLASTPLGPIYGAAAGSGIASLIQGKSIKKSLRAALISGGVAGLTRGLSGGFDTVKQDLASPGARFMGTLTGKGVGKGGYFTNPFKAQELGRYAKDDFRQGIYGPTPASSVSSLSASSAKANKLAAEVGNIKTSLGTNYTPAMDSEILKVAQDNISGAAPGFLSKYGPALAIGGVGLGAMGAFDEPEDEDQYDFFKDSPQYQPDMPLGKLSQDLLTSPGLGQPATYAPVPRRNVVVPSRFAANGGEIGRQYFPPRIGAISGPGTGTSDDVPAMLSDGEFVMTADAVRGAGGGSREQGMRNMYDMMRRFEGGPVRMSEGGDPTVNSRSDESWTLSDLMDPDKRSERSEEYYEEEETVENFMLDKIAVGELPPGATVEDLTNNQRRELSQALVNVRRAKMADYPYRMMPDSVIGTVGDIPKPITDLGLGVMDLYRDFQDGTIGRPDLRESLEGLGGTQ